MVPTGCFVGTQSPIGGVMKIGFVGVVLGLLTSPAAATTYTGTEAITGVESQYSNLTVDTDVSLHTLTTRPLGASERLPAVLFVQWLSCDTVSIGPRTDGWTQMLRGLVERSGFVVARTDKRGVGASSGGPCSELDYLTELADHRAAFTALRSHPWVDPSRIFVFGASMGGNMAPLVALDNAVAGVVVWGGGATTWFERQLGFERRAHELGNIPAEEINPRMSAIARFYQHYLLDGEAPDKIRNSSTQLAQAWGWMTGTQNDVHYGRPASFHQQAQAQNWPAAWGELQAPALVIYGEYDWFESADAHRLIVDIVSKHAAAEFHIVPKMDHHFTLYANAQSAFSETQPTADATPALSIVLRWLTKNSHP